MFWKNIKQLFFGRAKAPIPPLKKTDFFKNGFNKFREDCPVHQFDEFDGHACKIYGYDEDSCNIKSCPLFYVYKSIMK